MKTSVKTCFKCGKEKSLDEFYTHPMMKDGHLGKCKECTCRDTRLNRRKHIEYYREYDRNRGSRMTPQDTAIGRAAHPHWMKAHNAVQKAKYAGKLQKQPCEICGAPYVHAHHGDYSKPLDVIWLCPMHHRWIHA